MSNTSSSSKPTSLIIAAIDRSVDSTPRPPVWLRSLVGAALALPCVIGLVMAMGVKPTAPLVAKSDQYASLELQNGGSSDSLSSAAGSIAAVLPTGSVDSSSSFTRAKTAAPTVSEPAPPVIASTDVEPFSPAAETASSAQTIDDIFGITNPPAASNPVEPEEPRVALGKTPDPAAGGLVGLDIPGYPTTPAPSPSPAPGNVAPADPPSVVDPPSVAGTSTSATPAPSDVAMGPEGVPVPSGTAAGTASGSTGSTSLSPDLAGVPAPSTPDDVPAPSGTASEKVTDLRQLMRDIKEEVTDELDKKFPMYKPEDLVTLNLTSGPTVSGKIVYLQTSFMMLSSQGERPKLQYTRLQPGDRIRCDRAFRDAQISNETEKRVLDALK